MRAALIRELHASARATPPGALATLALLTTYGGGVLLSVAALVTAVHFHGPKAKPPRARAATTTQPAP